MAAVYLKTGYIIVDANNNGIFDAGDKVYLDKNKNQKLDFFDPEISRDPVSWQKFMRQFGVGSATGFAIQSMKKISDRIDLARKFAKSKNGEAQLMERMLSISLRLICNQKIVNCTPRTYSRIHANLSSYINVKKGYKLTALSYFSAAKQYKDSGEILQRQLSLFWATHYLLKYADCFKNGIRTTKLRSILDIVKVKYGITEEDIRNARSSTQQLVNKVSRIFHKK